MSQTRLQRAPLSRDVAGWLTVVRLELALLALLLVLPALLVLVLLRPPPRLRDGPHGPLGKIRSAEFFERCRMRFS